MTASKRQQIVAGNWKQNGNLALLNSVLAGLEAAALQTVKAVVCPPFPYLAAGTDKASVAIGAQDIGVHDEGAHTGDVAAAMLAEVGCRYAIVGHSERRQHYAESDQTVAVKASNAVQAGLIPIVCFGEPEAVRDAGQLYTFLRSQLQPVFAQLGSHGLQRAVLAYEPIWAIGTGKNASPAQAQQVHKYVRDLLAETHPEVAANISIIYGGSVKPANARELFAQDDIDGGLIGGASLQVESFVAICQAAE